MVTATSFELTLDKVLAPTGNLCFIGKYTLFSKVTHRPPANQVIVAALFKLKALQCIFGT